MIHQLDCLADVVGGLPGESTLIHSPRVAHLLGRPLDKLQALVALADLFERLPAGGVADQKAQFGDTLQVGLDRLQSRHEEVAHGELGALGGLENLPDVVYQSLAAVVYDVMSGHARLTAVLDGGPIATRTRPPAVCAPDQPSRRPPVRRPRRPEHSQRRVSSAGRHRGVALPLGSIQW